MKIANRTARCKSGPLAKAWMKSAMKCTSSCLVMAPALWPRHNQRRAGEGRRKNGKNHVSV